MNSADFLPGLVDMLEERYGKAGTCGSHVVLWATVVGLTSISVLAVGAAWNIVIQPIVEPVVPQAIWKGLAPYIGIALWFTLCTAVYGLASQFFINRRKRVAEDLERILREHGMWRDE